MKIKVNKEILIQGLQDVIISISPRTTLPILSTILLETTDNNILKLTATDLEICVKKEIPVTTIEHGKITIPGKKLYEIVREISGEEILIEDTKGFAIVIKNKKSFFKLLGFSPEEYPEIPEIEGRSFELPAKILKNMLTKTYFACSREETRYILNGVLFDFSAQNLRLVASDGRRLALCQVNIPQAWEAKYIVPQKAVIELLRIIENGGENIKITISKKNNQLAFYYDKTELITRLIEGDFPNYEEVIPKENKNKIKVKKEEFYQSIKRVSLMTTSDSIAVKLELYKDKIIISKITPELGEAKEEIDTEYKGEEMTIGFNPQYLIDVLKNIEPEEIAFELNGADKPAVFRIDSQYLYLILPMQLI